MQSVLAEKEQTEDTLMQVKEAGETLKRQFELALCTSVAERKEYETTVENLHNQMDQQRQAAASKLGSVVEQFETKVKQITLLAFLPTELYAAWSCGSTRGWFT